VSPTGSEFNDILREYYLDEVRLILSRRVSQEVLLEFKALFDERRQAVVTHIRGLALPTAARHARGRDRGTEAGESAGPV
jgi:hypothetical protein